MHQIIPVRHVPVPCGAARSGGPAPERLIPVLVSQNGSPHDGEEPVPDVMARFDVLLRVNVELIVQNGRPTLRSSRPLAPDDILGGLLPLRDLSGRDVRPNGELIELALRSAECLS